MKDILKEIYEKVVFFDGGTGTLLQELGLGAGEQPENWNISHPEIITKLHEDYIKAGCNIIKTNTFGANSLKFKEKLPDIVKSAIINAKKAARDDTYIALDIGPTGKLLSPLGNLSFEAAYELFKETITLGAKEDIDLILIETMSDLYETKAAVLAAKENCNLPVFVTMVFDEAGKLLTGGSAKAAVALLEGLGVDAIGVNCGLGPLQMEPIVEEFLQYSSVPIIVNPNAGLPKTEKGHTVYDISAHEFAEKQAQYVRKGVHIVGGCCGTTPDYIKELTCACENIPPLPIKYKEHTLVSSYSKVVELGKIPVIIGERINPTGKQKLKEALIQNNMEYILNEGIAQKDNGAHILDVNVGIPQIDEPYMMEQVVRELQSILDLPLQIDTSDPDALKRAMRTYNGKPMINSVNGKMEVMEQVFPLVKKYGGVVVGLALNEKGIPDNENKRFEIAQKICDTAEKYGIDKKNIVIDTLAMTISADDNSANICLNALERVKKELGVNTILGVSNISFGLPERVNINSTFLTMALQKGLSAAIINPGIDEMQRAYYSFLALSGLDDHCIKYIEKYGGQKAETEVLEDISLKAAIEKGLIDSAKNKAQELLMTTLPLQLINDLLIPALNKVGENFEKGVIFLPQLLMSAQAAKAAFDIVSQKIPKGAENKTKVLLATVKGDIHDIGKNIVKVVLQSYGYNVVDMGKDADPYDILQKVKDENLTIVGLSALMTTTVLNMEKTIKLLKEHVPYVKILVGGAVLTADYAKTIGADVYCKDAMAAVNYISKL